MIWLDASDPDVRAAVQTGIWGSVPSAPDIPALVGIYNQDRLGHPNALRTWTSPFFDTVAAPATGRGRPLVNAGLVNRGLVNAGLVN